MKIDNRPILLSPASLQLDLYREIIEERGDNMDINVLSVEAWLAGQLTKPRKDRLSILYQYAQALKDLSTDNIFYGSRFDYSFLAECQEFLSECALQKISSFPKRTKREQDLAEVLEKLQSVELWQQEAIDLPFDQADSIQILPTENIPSRQVWINRLLQNGAVLLKGKQEAAPGYWSCPNPRKEAEVIASAILEGELDASTVLVAADDPISRRFLQQAFDLHNIPWTILHPETRSHIFSIWKSALKYIQQPALEHLIEALAMLYPRTSDPLIEYIEEFQSLPQHRLSAMEYRSNPVISESEFRRLQDLEVQALNWKVVLERMSAWDYTSMEEIAREIQEQIPEPTQDDIRAFDAVTSTWMSVQSYVKSNEDLSLFVQGLDHMPASSTLSEIKGVLIGTRADISPLREHVFYMDAHSAGYPGFGIPGGIFDEAYRLACGFEPSEEANKKRLASLENVLSQIGHLYVLTPQSDLEGKIVDGSHEMDTFLAKKPVFHTVRDVENLSVPDFTLSSSLNTKMFGSPDGIQTRASALKSYERCPLQHLLRYGLHLRAPHDDRALQVSPDLLSAIIHEAVPFYNKPFYALSEAEVENLVQMQFAFPKAIWPLKAHEFDVLIQTTAKKIYATLQNLAPGVRDWKLNLESGTLPVLFEEEGGVDGAKEKFEVQDELGSNPHQTPFLLTDPSSRGFGLPHGDVKAVLSVSTNPDLVNKKPFVFTSPRGTKNLKPGQITDIHYSDVKQENLEQFYKKSVQMQSLDQANDSLEAYVSEKGATMDDLRKKAIDQARSLANSLREDKVLPLHEEGACKYCPYRSICRNGAVEKGKNYADAKGEQ